MLRLQGQAYALNDQSEPFENFKNFFQSFFSVFLSSAGIPLFEGGTQDADVHGFTPSSYSNWISSKDKPIVSGKKKKTYKNIATKQPTNT